jgi:hypothetical protein
VTGPSRSGGDAGAGGSGLAYHPAVVRIFSCLLWLWLGCSAPASGPKVAPPGPGPGPGAAVATGALPLDRIAIVGASVSVGFGGTPFGEAFAAAAPRSKVESYANLYLFRDPVGDSRAQVERALAFAPSALFAIDFLFWDVYGSPDPGWRDQALTAALAQLERARAAGSWLVVGDVPHVTTAAEWLLSKDHVPDRDTLVEINARISVWAAERDRVLQVPFASWAAPLTGNQEVELAPGERVPARTLMAADGLHANPLGVWYLLRKLDRFIEEQLPGTPADALVFARPAP